jgi:hypothetical protein
MEMCGQSASLRILLQTKRCTNTTKQRGKRYTVGLYVKRAGVVQIPPGHRAKLKEANNGHDAHRTHRFVVWLRDDLQQSGFDFLKHIRSK